MKVNFKELLFEVKWWLTHDGVLLICVLSMPIMMIISYSIFYLTHDMSPKSERVIQERKQGKEATVRR